MAQEKRELATSPEAELTELTALYEAKGLSPATARTVATELTSHGALAAHLDAELHIDPADIPSPVQAAAASALSCGLVPAPLPQRSQGVLVRTLGNGQALDTDRKPGIVQHGEHVTHALVGLADRIADRPTGIAVGHDARRAGVNPELVLDRHTTQVVAGSQRPVPID